jgi:hypothetical protein
MRTNDPLRDAILLKEPTAYFTLQQGTIFLYKPHTVVLTFQDIKFINLNQKGTPILEIDGERISGYGAISHKLFGYYRRDIAKIISPYLTPDPAQLQIVGTRTYKGNTYPVFTYGDSKQQIKGFSNLKKLFPNLTQLQLNQLKQQTPTQPQRHTQLIAKYNITKVANSYELTVPTNSPIQPVNPQTIYLTSQKKVIDFLKSHGESVSRETAQKLFKEINDGAE